jgi:glycosyltransferase involved in cell wall biosynthesis
MRISVIMPCHNAGRWIGEALQSTSIQTRPPDEVIVIDDASIDDSVEQIQNSGVEVRLLRASCRNAAAARNIGIEAATGDWLAFLDADDIWYPQHLERAQQLLQSSEDVAFLADYHLFKGNSQNVEPLAPPLISTGTRLTPLHFMDLLTRGFRFGHSTVLLKRERVLEVGGFDVRQQRRHDIDLWLKVLAKHTWGYDAVPAMAYRMDTPESLSRNVVSCEYFWLRALLKNRKFYDVPAVQKLISLAARHAISLALVDGDMADLQRARSLAWPHLKPSSRVFFRCAALCRPPFQQAIRARRWVMARRDNETNTGSG